MTDNAEIIKLFLNNGLSLLKQESLFEGDFFDYFEDKKESYENSLIEVMEEVEESNLIISEMKLFNNFFENKKLDVNKYLDIFKVILKSIKNIFRDNLIIRIMTEFLLEIYGIIKIIKSSSNLEL